MKELVEYMAKALVDSPEQVQVHEVVKDQLTVLQLRVAAEDMGRVIGRQGRTARSMRAIVTAAGVKAHRRCTLDIEE